MYKDNTAFKVEGYVEIRSFDDEGNEELLLSKKNAIHKENFSLAAARAMGTRQDGHIFSLHFGTGGATVDALDHIVYASPNVVGAADLNIPVYQEVVDGDRGAPAGNSISVQHLMGTEYSDIIITCVLDKTEPSGQAAFDNVTESLSGQFVFDEMGLKTDDGLLLTHFTFSPIEKTANRIMQIIYTIRITVV